MELPLREIHLPDPVSVWTLAIGWWIVFGLILTLIFISFTVVRKLLKPTLKKQAKKLLGEIEKSFLETGDATHCIAAISVFLRRIVLSQKHSEILAGLTGVAWLKLLDQQLKEPEFSQGIGQILLTGPYSLKADQSEVLGVIQLCKKWVNTL